MNLLKRLCTGILCIGLLLASLPIGVLADIRVPSQAQASNYTSSKALATLLTGVFNGDIDIYSNGGCTNEVSMPLGLSMNKKTTYYLLDKTDRDSIGGRQCYVYAQAVYNKLFNECVGHADGLNHSRVAISGGGKTVSYDQFTKAGIRCGAYMRTTNKSSGAYNGSYGHSMIILSYDSNGVTYLEGNGDGDGLIRIDTKTWSDFNSSHLSGRSRYVCHVVQPTDTYYNTNFVTYTVTYNANGGTNAPADQEKKHGTTLTLSSTIPTRSGYTFQGWGTAANATSVAYKAGAGYTANANATLYAVWVKGCPGSHDYRYKVTTAPTTEKAGALTGTCALCDKTTTVALPKLTTGDYSYNVTTAPTCTAEGIGQYTWKTTTYGSFSFNTSVDSTGHSYESGLCIHCGEEDPDYTVLTLTATCFGGHNEDVTVQVYQGEELLHTEDAQDGICQLQGLAAGEYTITFSKKNHVTEAQTLVLEAGSSTLDVIIYLVGDLTGDGKVNISDISKLYIQIREGSIANLSRADINTDGRVDVIDASQLYAHIRGTKPLH